MIYMAYLHSFDMILAYAPLFAFCIVGWRVDHILGLHYSRSNADEEVVVRSMQVR